MERTWLKNYPTGVAQHVNANEYASLVELLDNSFRKYATLTAYKFMGKDYRYALIDELSRAFGAYVQTLGLAPGDRVAVMMPNIPQYPVVVAGILRVGLVVVNVNPLYTPRELEHQLKDSGAKAIIVFEKFAITLQQVLHQVPSKKIVLTSVGDMLGWLKGGIVNLVLRRVKKEVPAFDLPGAVRFNDAIAQGRRATFQPAKVGCCSTPAAPPASARARYCCTATSWPTSCSPTPGTSPRSARSSRASRS
jgi:long-chain acyl-CoA synthetase